MWMTEFIITCPSELDADGHYRIDRWKELIRCKDCKHCDDIDMYGYVQCDKAETHEPDWFCADGERRSE